MHGRTTVIVRAWVFQVARNGKQPRQRCPYEILQNRNSSHCVDPGSAHLSGTTTATQIPKNNVSLRKADRR